MTSFSVIIPTLREEAGIGVLLRALQAQDYEEQTEIIVVDGGSEDDTQAVVKSFDGVCLLQSERGVSRQRNAGADAATGKLVVFMDADNVPPPDFLRRIAASYGRLPFAVACPWFVARDDGSLVRFIYLVFNLLFFLGQGWLRTGSGVCLIAPRAVWESCGGFDETLHLGEDIRFIRQAARHGMHRHLLIPLPTSGRRFREKGVWKLLKFYARITPSLLLGRYDSLKTLPYEAAPYGHK
jgi:glycosyltransferase involved in cell wall biosynthesis